MSIRIDDGSGEVSTVPGMGILEAYGPTAASLYGSTIPTSGLPGFAHGCIFHRTNGTGTTDALYINTGSNTSCTFTELSALVLAQQALVTNTQTFPLQMEKWKIWDDMKTNLGSTALSADDLIFTVGTFGTTAPLLISSVATASNVSQYARQQFAVPSTYVAGSAISVVISALATAHNPDTLSNVNADVYRAAAPTVNIQPTTATGTDISSGGATQICQFPLTATNIVPGELLDIRVKTSLNDSTTTGTISLTKIVVTATCYA